MGEICASGSVGGEGGNVLAYPATRPAMPREMCVVAGMEQPCRHHEVSILILGGTGVGRC